MTEHRSKPNTEADSTRRQFLKNVGFGVVAGGMAGPLLEDARSQTSARKVKSRVLGKTGLKVSEIGIGGHSWAYKQVPDGKGGLRRPTVEEAMRMISDAMDKGVNFFDSCTPLVKSSTPGEALKRLGLKPGPQFGVILRSLRDAWLDGRVRDEAGEQALLDDLLKSQVTE